MSKKKTTPLAGGASESPVSSTVHGKDANTGRVWKLTDLLAATGGCELLSCPHCHSEFSVHLSRAEAFTRPHDGAATGTRYAIPAHDPMIDPTGREAELTIDDDVRDCPSVSRGGALLHFVCEHGCPEFAVSIAQVKGMTQITVGDRDDLR